MRIIRIAQFIEEDDDDPVSQLKSEIDEEASRGSTDPNAHGSNNAIRQRKRDPNRTPNGKFYLLQDLLGNDEWEKLGSYPSIKKLCRFLYDHLAGISRSGEYVSISRFLAISPDMQPIPLWLGVVPDMNLGKWMVPDDFPCVGNSEDEVDGIMQAGYANGTFPERMEYQTFSNEKAIDEFRENPEKFATVMRSRNGY